MPGAIEIIVGHLKIKGLYLQINLEFLHHIKDNGTIIQVIIQVIQYWYIWTW